jgi:DNA-binding response OmpR family regulator
MVERENKREDPLYLYFLNTLSDEELKTEEGDRTDQKSGQLGNNLSMKEIQLYRIILEADGEPISTEEISEKLFNRISDLQCVWTTISRIKRRLGDVEIFKQKIEGTNSKGYASRRVRIENGLILE